MVDEDGQQLGVMPLPNALIAARERCLDLVLIAPDANPPVCRISDVGKLKYEESKRDKEARKAQKAGVLKEVKLSAKIAQHDFEVRVQKVRECIEKKNKVKATLQFRGREMMHSELGKKVMERLIDAVIDVAKVESPPKLFGKLLIAIIVPK